MKQINELVLFLSIIIIGATWTLFFAIMGVHQYYVDSLHSNVINWAEMGNSQFRAIPFGVMVMLFGFIGIIRSYVSIVKDNKLKK